MRNGSHEHTRSGKSAVCIAGWHAAPLVAYFGKVADYLVIGGTKVFSRS
jgi:hypothetical protein